jgi:hypothetical protein
MKQIRIPADQWDCVGDGALQAINWFYDYLMSPHPEIGREGSVCPFVGPSVQAESLVLHIVQFDAEPGRDETIALVWQMARMLDEDRWENKNRTLRAIVSVLPDLEGPSLGLLDEVQKSLKPDLAAQGLMLGQFHELCNDTAARNPNFLVSRSPVPVLALRHMAFHDVLFLGDERSCFASYDERFGKRYESGGNLDALLVQTYEKARARFADDATLLEI